MNTLLKVLHLLAVIPLLMSGCAILPAPADVDEGAVSKTAVYESILGKSPTDHAVVDFLAENDCSSTEQTLLCHGIGMALRTDSNQIVETVYLYLNNADGFQPYKGELPLGLKFYDTMGAVEYKMGKLEAGDSLRPTTSAGLPDQGGSPDHMHYWAIYRRYGMTIIYNSPFADEDATINAIVIRS